MSFSAGGETSGHDRFALGVYLILARGICFAIEFVRINEPLGIQTPAGGVVPFSPP